MQPLEEAEPQIYKVDKPAFKVFQMLFYTPSTSHHPGEVPYTDFIHALRSVGFGVEKMYGSVWQFTPTNLGVENSIHFHEPKISFTKARIFGRRLYRNYEWDGKSFVLDE